MKTRVCKLIPSITRKSTKLIRALLNPISMKNCLIFHSLLQIVIQTTFGKRPCTTKFFQFVPSFSHFFFVTQRKPRKTGLSPLPGWSNPRPRRMKVDMSFSTFGDCRKIKFCGKCTPLIVIVWVVEKLHPWPMLQRKFGSSLAFSINIIYFITIIIILWWWIVRWNKLLMRKNFRLYRKSEWHLW